MGRNDSILRSSSSLRLDRRSGEDCFVRFTDRCSSGTPSSRSLCLFVMLDVRVQVECGQNMLCTVMGDRNVQPLGGSGDAVEVAVRPEEASSSDWRVSQAHATWGKTSGPQAFNCTLAYTLYQDQNPLSMLGIPHLATCEGIEAGLQVMTYARPRHNGQKHHGYS